MSRMIDRNKRDMQPLEGAGGGAGGGGRRGGISRKEGAALMGAPAAAGLAAVGASVVAGRKQDAAERDKAIVRTENMQRKAAKPRMHESVKADLLSARDAMPDESSRHYKGFANSTKQK